MGKQREVKKIGNYRIEFLTKFNSRQSDAIFLRVSCSDDFKQLLKKAISEIKPDLTEINHYSGRDSNNHDIYNKYKRHHVKPWVYNSLTGNHKGFLFLDDFVKNGVMELGFLSSDVLERAIEELKQNYKLFIEVLGKFSNLKMSVVYELNL